MDQLKEPVNNDAIDELLEMMEKNNHHMYADYVRRLAYDLDKTKRLLDDTQALVRHLMKMIQEGTVTG